MGRSIENNYNSGMNLSKQDVENLPNNENFKSSLKESIDAYKKSNEYDMLFIQLVINKFNDKLEISGQHKIDFIDPANFKNFAKEIVKILEENNGKSEKPKKISSAIYSYLNTPPEIKENPKPEIRNQKPLNDRFKKMTEQRKDIYD